MSDTPRTDSCRVLVWGYNWEDELDPIGGQYVPFEKMQQLERELADAKTELVRKDEALRKIVEATPEGYLRMGVVKINALAAAALAQGGKEGA